MNAIMTGLVAWAVGVVWFLLVLIAVMGMQAATAARGRVLMKDALFLGGVWALLPLLLVITGVVPFVPIGLGTAMLVLFSGGAFVWRVWGAAQGGDNSSRQAEIRRPYRQPLVWVGLLSVTLSIMIPVVLALAGVPWERWVLATVAVVSIATVVLRKVVIPEAARRP